ncbi:MAG: hypothetical protein AB8G11_06775 [Saprospiraceae bacterium]
MKIRKAIPNDVKDFIKVKNQLPFKYSDGRTSSGGFLLGTDEATYLKYITNDYCLVAENESGIVGFGIMLKDESVKKSDVWTRREQAIWTINIKDYEQEKICYFEQLAFLKGHSRTVMSLAYNLTWWAFEDGHTHFFTTTVKYPITNLAAVPYILKASGKKVGNIDEAYPIIGQINSDIYMIKAANFYETAKASKLLPFLQKHYIRFS